MKNRNLNLLILILFLLSCFSFFKGEQTFSIYRENLSTSISLTVVDPTVYYTVSFDTDGGSYVEPRQREYNQTLGEIPITSKPDYNFLGWYADPEHTIRVNSDTKITGDVIFYAYFRKTVCKKAVSGTLHTETCSPTDVSGCLINNAHPLNTTITYGNIPRTGTYLSGDAYDCDVNNDGIYSPTTERFYLMRYIESRESMALVYYASIDEDGVIDTKVRSGKSYSFDDAKSNLPTSTSSSSIPAWSNPALTSFYNRTSRFIYSYDVRPACLNSESASLSHASLDNCQYLLENTSYQSNEKSEKGIWLDRDIDSHYYGIVASNVSFEKVDITNTNFTVRPVIEVPVTTIEDYPYRYMITFDSQSNLEIESRFRYEGQKVGTLPKPTRSGYDFLGWFTDLNYTTRVSAETLTPSNDVTYYARWAEIVDNLEYVFRVDGTCDFAYSGEYITSSQNNCIGVKKDGTTINYAASEHHYIDTGIALFSRENAYKDFEIGLTIDTIGYTSTTQMTFLNAKLENSSINYPGFVFRQNSDSHDTTELTGKFNGNSYSTRVQNSTGTQIRIIRRHGRIYYIINNDDIEELAEISDFEQFFNLTVWFGASARETDPEATGENSDYFREAESVLSNMYIKLERDDASDEHTVTFQTDGGTLDMPATRVVAHNKIIGLLPTVTRPHYTFNGWRIADGDLITPDYLIKSDVIIYADFTPDLHTITFDTNKNAQLIEVEKYFNEQLGTLPVPSDNHYTFAGWYTDTDYTEQITEQTIVTANVTYYAKWVPDPHTITFDSQGGSEVNTINTSYGSKIGNLEIPTKDGSIFAGWFTDTNYNKQILPDKIVTGDARYVARWVTTAVIKVSFNSQSGSAISPIYTNYGDALGTLPTPTKTYHVFVGWYADSDFSKPVNSSTTVLHDTTLYAKWIVDSRYVASIGDTYYESLATAISAAPANTKTTINVIKDISLSANITIDSNKDVIIDGNNHEVSNASGEVFVNDGILELRNGNFINTGGSAKKTIVNSNADSVLRITSGYVGSTNSNSIDNNGIIYITGGTIETTTAQGTINNNATGIAYISGGKVANTDTRQAIYNAGQVYISGSAHITANGGDRATIHNFQSGARLEISGGEIYQTNGSCKRGAIENVSGATVIITGGKIVSRSGKSNYNASAVQNSGTLVIGKKDGVYDVSAPILQSRAHGVVSTVNYYVYDGVIKGETNAVKDKSKIPAANSESGFVMADDYEYIGGVRFNTLHYELASGFRVTLNDDNGVSNPHSKVVLENTAVGDLPIPVKSGYVFSGWYTENEELVTSSTIVTSDTTYTAKWLKSVSQANISNPTISLIKNTAQVVIIKNNNKIEPITYLSNNTNIATVNSEGVVTGVAPGITRITLLGTRSGDKKYIDVIVNYSETVKTFDILSEAMRTYFNNIEDWLIGQTDDSHNSYDSYMSANLLNNNCSNYYKDDRLDQSTATGILHCDQPNEFDTGQTGSITVYEYNQNTNSVIGVASYATVNNGKIYNLIPGKAYYWELDSDITKNGKFYAYGERRVIRIDNTIAGMDDSFYQTRNVRDLGGIKVTYENALGNTVTGKIKYGKLYRGEKIFGGNGDAIQYFTKLGINHEMDLRGDDEIIYSEEDSFASANKVISSGSNNTFEIIHYNIGYSLQNLSNYNLAREAVLRVMNEIVNNANYSLYFHSNLGADRAGTLAYLLEGILGVSEEDRYRDYEMTVFFGLDERTRFYSNNESNDLKFVHMKKAIRDAGLYDTEDVVEWFLKGSSNAVADMELIQNFRTAMIDLD